jgi:AcrR family transcriptional regulator
VGSTVQTRAMKKPARRARARSPRIRRTAEDARTAILDAAERRLVERGPSGIRLQDVAADVGVSHPTILHHFGSREHLVEAVIQRRVHAMGQEVTLSLLSAPAAGETKAAVALFESLHRTFSEGGHARVLAFCALEGRMPVVTPGSLRPFAQATHAARVARRQADQPPASFAETEHVVHLVSLALFGEAILGPFLRGEPQGKPDKAASKRFRDWLAKHALATLER